MISIFSPLQAIFNFVYGLYYSWRAPRFIKWFNKNNKRNIKLLEKSDFYKVDFTDPFEYDNPTISISIPEYVIKYLREIEIPKENTYKNIGFFGVYSFVPFTRGVDLNEQDFEFIARRAIDALLFEYDHPLRLYTTDMASELSFVLQNIILKFLKNQKAPEDVIDCLTDFSKAIQFTDTFDVTFIRPDMTRCFIKGTKFCDLDKENSLRDYLECLKESEIQLSPMNTDPKCIS